MRHLEEINPFLRSRSQLLNEPGALRLLHMRSEQAQRFRRLLLQGAKVLIVGGGPKSKLRFYRHLASLHIELYLMDYSEGLWPAIAKSHDSPFRAFFPVDFSDLPALGINAPAAIKAANNGLIMQFDAVFTFFEIYVQHAALIQSALSPPAPTSPSPIVPAVRPLLATLWSPTGSPPQVGVVNVSSEAEVRIAVQRVLQYGKSNHKNHQDIPELGRLFTNGSHHHMILEQFLDGPEFDVDILFNNGEAGPSRFPRGRQLELEDMAVPCAKAVGAVDGVAHVELRYTRDGPRLIEVNARMGGAAIFDLHQRVWAVDLVENHCMAMCGIPIRPVVSEIPLCHLSCIILYAPYSGRVTSERWLEFLREDDRVINVVYETEKGAMVNGPEDSIPDWVGQVHVIGRTRPEIEELVRDIVTRRAPVPIKANEAGSERPYFFPGDQFPFRQSHRV